MSDLLLQRAQILKEQLDAITEAESEQAEKIEGLNEQVIKLQSTIIDKL